MKPDSRRYLWGPFFVLVITLGATAAAVWQFRRMADAEDAVRFEKYVAGTQSALEDQMESYIAFAREGAAMFGAGRTPTAAQFRAFAARMTPKMPPARDEAAQSSATAYAGLLGAGWIRREEPARRKSAAATISPGGLPRIVLDRGKYARFGFAYVEPADWRRQLAAAADEMFTDTASRSAMARARDTGKPVISAQVTVIHEFWARKRSGFHVFAPVYEGGSVPATLAARRELLAGFLAVSVQSDEMFAAVHAGEAGRQLDLEVYDGVEPAAGEPLFRSDAARPIWDAGHQPRYSRTVLAQLPGRTWELVFHTRPEFEQASERTFAPTIALIGVLLSLLLAGVNFVQRRASAAMNASELRYRRLFEASTDGVFLFDADTGRVTDVNPYMAELLETGREELLKRHIWDIGLFSDDAAGRAAFEELRKKSYRRYDHLPIVAPSGRRHDIEFTCNAYMSGRRRVMQCNVRNITDRKRAQDALRESEERYRSLLEVNPQGVWLVAPDGRPQYVNLYWLEYSGMPLEQCELRWAEQMHPDDRAQVVRGWDGARAAGNAYEAEVRMRRADGVYRWHLMRGVPVRDEEGRAHDWMCVFIDIDERKQTEQDRTRLLQREHTLRTQAEAANRAKDEFLATLSHELRTPLNAILGWTQTLQQGDNDPALVKRALAQIDASANAQARLVNDLLNVADIGSGRMRLDIQPIELVPLVDAVVESLRPALAARGIAFELVAGPEAARLAGDAARLQQIFWNLLSNAVKFTAPGGRIGMRLARVGQHIEISVTDDGEGISPDFLPYVFDRFRQADASIRRRHGGLGLGLAIVRHLTELHGGTVHAQSAGEGRGSRFVVLLPMRPPAQPGEAGSAPAAAPPAPVPPRNAGSVGRLSGLRILSVDDDDSTREMLQEALERAGAQVDSAASAAEALRKLGARRPDVLVSDIGLPEEDGYDLMRKVRALDSGAGGATPAVALTGYAREQDRRAILAAGYQEFVAKPVNLGELAEAILRAHANRAARRGER